MPPSMNHDDEVMLALAALTYRGFGKHSEAAIADELRPWLRMLESEGLGRWALVWGPAAFRAETSLFDDAMVYVARREDPSPGARPHYAVAIRGTNPVSAFDWIFGDLFVQLRVPWASKRPETGKLSASTALGLAIVRHLAAQSPPSQAGNLAQLGKDVTSGLRLLAQKLPELLPNRMLEQPESFRNDDLEIRLEELKHRVGNALEGLDAVLSGGAQSLRDAIDERVFNRLLERIAATPDTGKTLLAFLKQAVPANARVAVTGHSKGGALAIATALWLDEAWAAETGGEIECFSFAGPTAGDATFARYYDTRLAARTRRVANVRDIVPHAWNAAELRELRKPYPVLARAITALTASIESHGYTHVGGSLVPLDVGPGPQADLVQEIIYQHLDAYLAVAAFKSSKWNARTIFLES